MSFDGFVTRCVTDELRGTILGGKIDKIYQPERDEIIISVRTYGVTYKMLLSASASNPRIHLTTTPRENPKTPPMLCMLMRKHLSGGQIINIEQLGFDRVVRIDIEVRNELGDLCVKSIIIEIMGRHSNIILTDENNKIMDSAKHIDFTVSAVRQILPGLIYVNPPMQNKSMVDKISATEFLANIEKIDDDTIIDKFLVSYFMGMSPLLAREIVYGFCQGTHLTKKECDCAAFVVYTLDYLKRLVDGECTPSLVIDNIQKSPMSFSCVKLMQYENAATVEEYSSISQVIDVYYEKRSNREHMNRRSAALLKLLANNIERCEKKIVLHRENLISSAEREKFKMFGDLITANIYRINYGMESVRVENFYSENNEEIEILLNSSTSPSQNAQKYYKKYAKAKTAEIYSTEQISIAEAEKYYLESVVNAIENAQTPAELDEIRTELANEGYIIKQNKSKKKDAPKFDFMKFISVDGYEILVGRNNVQNDRLTMKTAYSTDIWFHTKNIPGCHTIVRTNGTGEAPDSTMMQAAKIAAYFSKGRNSSQVPVDYTVVKNVKKPNGARPGMVIYDNYNTVYVLPEVPENQEK